MKIAFALVLVFVLVACSAAGVPPTEAPGSSGPDSPVTSPPDGTIGGGAAPAGPGQPTLVLPKPGQHDVHDVAIEELSFRAAGRHVVLNARWWSGVEPCSVLDSVAVTREGTTITVAVREGSGAGDVACIDIAMLKVTPIDLGDLEPGDYTVRPAAGTAPAIVVPVS